MTSIYIATEDVLSEAIADRLVADVDHGLTIAVRMGRRGNGYLKNKLSALKTLSNSIPVFMLTDLDSVRCPPTLIHSWSGGQALPRSLLLRVIVREVEAWLMADRDAFASFISAPIKKIPLNPELIDKPKETLLSLVNRYSSKTIKAEILPLKGTKSKIGIGYNQILSGFVMRTWNPDVAKNNSESLARACLRLSELTKKKSC